MRQPLRVRMSILKGLPWEKIGAVGAYLDDAVYRK